MKHIKSYDQFLTESKTAKEIEAKINKMGAPKDDKKQLADDMADASKGPTTPPEELDAEADAGKKEAENKAKKKKTKTLAKKMKDSSKGEEEIELEVVEAAAKNEDHEEMGDKVLNMGVGDLLDIMKEKDPKGYEDIEAYIKKNVAKSADESWFTTMTS
jgi:hypothetical protein